MNERIAFGPKALSRFTHMVEEVGVELGENGVLRSTEMRTRLAQKLFGLARFWWTDTQIKQLLLRALRKRGLNFPNWRLPHSLGYSRSNSSDEIPFAQFNAVPQD